MPDGLPALGALPGARNTYAALGFFRNVRVFSDRSPEGRVLIFDVEENPVVRQISITGNDHIDSDKIRDALTLTTGSTLDYPLLYENRERIVGLYRAEGYYLAEVEFEIEPSGEASVGINSAYSTMNPARLAPTRLIDSSCQRWLLRARL